MFGFSFTADISVLESRKAWVKAVKLRREWNRFRHLGGESNDKHSRNIRVCRVGANSFALHRLRNISYIRTCYDLVAMQKGLDAWLVYYNNQRNLWRNCLE